jgi:flagellar motility protein MotE (MotC chaperone)
MLSEFKNFNKDRLDLHELLALAAFGRILRAECESQKVDEPPFVDVQLKTLRREIAAKVDDQRQARRRQIDAQLDSLKTPTERRKELEKEKAELEAIGA